MNAWLDPLRSALESASAPVTCFFRDDDAGWRGDRLRPVLARFAELGLPLDLAVIPAALDRGGARELRDWCERANLGLHQHGYAHANHEPAGERKCEFGPSRGAEAQLRDIATGRERLWLLLGPAVEPIFTPPWNRCIAETGRCLVELGFTTLSREAKAPPLDLPGLSELPVSVDWLKRRDGARLPRQAIAELAAAAVERGGPVGVMLHHAEMDGSELDAASELLTLLRDHERTSCVRMRDVTRLPETAPAAARAHDARPRDVPPTATPRRGP